VFVYDLCGLCVRSEIKIPSFLRHSDFSAPTDISIKLSFDFPKLTFPDDKIIFESDKVYYECQKNIIACITNDSDILVFINNKDDIEDLYKYIISIPIGYALANKGYSVLHGGAISFNDKSACIVGFSGQGKSTMTLSLLGKGFKFITDDLVVIKNDKIISLNPWIKTNKRTIDNLKIDYLDQIKLYKDHRQRSLFKIPEENCLNDSFVKVFYFPVKGEKKSIKKMKKNDAFKFLFTNFYRFYNDQANDLNKISEILEKSSFYLFERNINDPIEENADYLSEHIKLHLK